MTYFLGSFCVRYDFQQLFDDGEGEDFEECYKPSCSVDDGDREIEEVFVFWAHVFYLM